jgi:5-methylthioribose kinase
MILTKELNSQTQEYFIEQGWLEPDEEILDFSKAGEGNMNFVARVCTKDRSFIVKQSRPYVEKYQQVLAPIERIEIENAFYQCTNSSVLIKSFSPEIISFDELNHTLVMEDLGLASDFLSIYVGTLSITEKEIERLVGYLVCLHNLEQTSFPDNCKMKALNHEHIFHYPFLEANGFDLDTVQKGLQVLSKPFKRNEDLKEKIRVLGLRYLEKGSTLLHGDFYPGSWLEVGVRLKVIDPEFAFLGDAEFDLAVMLAHFMMAGLGEETIQFAKSHYKKHRKLDEHLLNQYIGVEILRRLIGLAQLPLGLSLEDKKVLAQRAEKMILE